MTSLKKKLVVAVGFLVLCSLVVVPLALLKRGGKYDFLGELASKEKVFAMTGSGSMEAPGYPEQVIAVDSVLLKGVTREEASDAVAAALPPDEWIRHGYHFEAKQKWNPGQPYADSITVDQNEDKVMVQKSRRFKPLERQLLGLEHKLQGL